MMLQVNNYVLDPCGTTHITIGDAGNTGNKTYLPLPTLCAPSAMDHQYVPVIHNRHPMLCRLVHVADSNDCCISSTKCLLCLYQLDQQSLYFLLQIT